MAYTVSERDEIKNALISLLKGERVVTVRTQGRETTYQMADIDDLRAVLAEADSDVAAAAGSRRFCLVRSSKGAF